LLHSLSHPITILSKEYMHLNSMGHSWIGPPPRAASSTSLNGRVLPNNALNLRTVYTLRSTFERSTDVVPIRAASNALSRSIPKSRRQATACLSVYRRGAASAVVIGQRCFFSSRHQFFQAEKGIFSKSWPRDRHEWQGDLTLKP
jgi:hypothetical protein